MVDAPNVESPFSTRNSGSIKDGTANREVSSDALSKEDTDAFYENFRQKASVLKKMALAYKKEVDDKGVLGTLGDFVSDLFMSAAGYQRGADDEYTSKASVLQPQVTPEMEAVQSAEIATLTYLFSGAVSGNDERALNIMKEEFGDAWSEVSGWGAKEWTPVVAVTAAAIASTVVAKKALAPIVVQRSIGKSGFGSVEEFSAETLSRYQRYTDEAYDRVLKLEKQGKIQFSNNVPRETVIGRETDRIARARMTSWLKSEGIIEGPGELIQLNRWLRDPAGSGSYRIPDVRIPEANLIMDGTIGYKWWTTDQIKDFYQFSSGNTIVVVRPTQLGGSYSIVPK